MGALVRIITVEDLHAYVDGRLEGRDRQDVERLLLTDERAANAVADFQRQNRLLKKAFGNQTMPKVLASGNVIQLSPKR